MMLVYRCWVVYGRSWLVISLPGLLVLGNTAVTGVVLYLEITLNQHALLSVKQIKPFGAAFWALTIVINIITTGAGPTDLFKVLTYGRPGLIVARMWRINRGTQDIIYRPERRGPRPSTTLQHIMRIVIESGLLYTGTSLITFISYVTNSVAVYVTTDIVCFKIVCPVAALTTATGDTSNWHRVQPHYNSCSAFPQGILFHHFGLWVPIGIQDEQPVDRCPEHARQRVNNPAGRPGGQNVR
jgi:hypothetical protein